MKILYLAGARPGAEYQLTNYLKHCNHEIKIGAYYDYTPNIKYVDWILDAFPVNNNKQKLQNDILNFKPDIAIVDGVYYKIPTFLEKMGIDIFYISPLELMSGINWWDWFSSRRRYASQFQDEWKLASRRPEGVHFIYSPFALLSNHIPVLDRFEWIQSYHQSTPQTGSDRFLVFIENKKRLKQLSLILEISRIDCEIVSNFNKFIKLLPHYNYVICTGETYQISEIINSGKKCILLPSFEDSETLVNSYICELLGVGIDLSQLENMGHFAVDELVKTCNKLPKLDYQLSSSAPYLHEKVNEIWESM